MLLIFIVAPKRNDPSDFDTLLGHSFGTNKRSFPKRNFDEIDAAGFNGFSKRNFDEIDNAGFNGFSKKNFDEIDNAGFKDYLRKRNFDEIDAAGFNDFSKRGDCVEGKAIDSADDKLIADLPRQPKGGDVKCKKNFDEIDAAGFNDFSKRGKIGLHPFAFRPDGFDENDPKYNPIKAFLLALKYKIPVNFTPFNADFKDRKSDEFPPIFSGNKPGPFYDFFFNFLKNKDEKFRDFTPFNPGFKGGKFGDMPPYFMLPFLKKFNDFPPFYPAFFDEKQGDIPPFYPPFFPMNPDTDFTPGYPDFVPYVVKYFKYKNAKKLVGLGPRAILTHDDSSKFLGAESDDFKTQH